MNKMLRSVLLQLPEAYRVLYDIKNNYLINFYLKKVHEMDFNGFKLICQNNPQLFLDIGANAGMSALSIYTLKPNAAVISFEPNPLNYPYLEKLADKFDNFQYEQVGLGDQAGLLEFYYPVYNSKKMTALGSCNYLMAKSWLNNDTVYFFNSNKLEIEKVTVEIKTLDSFQLKPEFIKVDVEGFEYQVLLGGEKTIKENLPILLIEGVTQNSKVHNILKDWGYSAYKYSSNQFHLDEFDCVNNFFVPKEKKELIQPYCA